LYSPLSIDTTLFTSPYTNKFIATRLAASPGVLSYLKIKSLIAVFIVRPT